MLTPAQKYALDYHLRETNLLTNEELILELTDHYTTSLIERMAPNMTFETALTDVQTAFGGRKGLQKMERQYNQVTFRRYDERWRQALSSQFRKPLLWRQTVPVYTVLFVLACIAYMPTQVKIEEGLKWNHFIGGFFQGTLLGIIFPVLGIIWPYLKTTLRYGIHNAPTKVLYLLKRHFVLLFVIYGVGIIGYFGLLPVLIYPLQAILASVYLAVVGLYIRTARIIYELFYETYSTH